MGARRVGVFSLPPLGCFPVSITEFGHGRSGCVSRLNRDSQMYNKKLNIAINSLSTRYHDLKIVVLDIYTPLYNLATSPGSQGRNLFVEVRIYSFASALYMCSRLN